MTEDQSVHLLREEPATKQELWARITFDPAVLQGKPVIRGLRIGVEHILRALGAGVSDTELLADYPDLEPDDIRAVLLYAATLVAEERVFYRPAFERSTHDCP